MQGLEETRFGEVMAIREEKDAGKWREWHQYSSLPEGWDFCFSMKNNSKTFKLNAVAQLESLPILNLAFNAKNYFRNEKFDSIMMKKNYKNCKEAGEKIVVTVTQSREKCKKKI